MIIKWNLMNDINRLTLKKQQFIFINLIKFNWTFTTAICPSSSILESFFINLYFAGDVRLKKIETTFESRLIVLNNRNWCYCSIEKKFHISNLKHFWLELWPTNKFHEICTSRGDFITRDSGLLKMPGKLVLLSDMIMVDEVECRNTNWKLQRVCSL